MNAFIAVAGFITVAAITPGPNNLVVMGTAARGGFSATIPAIVGVVAGSLILLALVWAGASAAFDMWPWLRSIMILSGCSYLVWLGCGLIRQAGRRSQGSFSPHLPDGFVGLAVFQLLNPKSWMLITTATAAVSEIGREASHFAVLATMLLVVTSICLAIWALAGAKIAAWLSEPDRSAIFDCTMGGVLVLTGLFLLL